MVTAPSLLYANAAFNAAVRAQAEALVSLYGAVEAAARSREIRRQAAAGPARTFAYNVEAICAECAGQRRPDGSGGRLGDDMLNGLQALGGAAVALFERRFAGALRAQPALTDREIAAARLGITPRQVECLRHAALGLSAKASGLQFEPTLHWRTVEGHLARAYARLNAGTKAQAIARARDEGLLGPPT